MAVRDPQAAAIGVRLRAELAGVAKSLTMEITAALIEACPVDTGHARRNFVPSLGVPFEGVDDGAAQIAGQAAVLGYTLVDGDIHVTNNVPYIGPLIGGSSDQAPPGWDIAAVDRAVAAVQARYDGVTIDVTTSGLVSERGAAAAFGLAGAYSPFGGEE